MDKFGVQYSHFVHMDRTSPQTCNIQILTVVNINVTFLWDVTQYNLAGTYQQFGGSWSIHLQGVDSQFPQNVCIYTKKTI
jgi:hypothetical protein